MNELEADIRATLRADAEEAVLSTNTYEDRRKLEDRLDVVDRHESRSRWLALAGAAAVIVAVLVGLTALRPSTGAAPAVSGPPTAVSPSASTYEATMLTPVATFALPDWVTRAEMGDWTKDFMYLDQNSSCPVSAPCTERDQRKIRGYTVRAFRPPGASAVVRNPSYAALVTGWQSLAGRQLAIVTDPATTTVGGRPAATMTVTMKKPAPGISWCSNPADATSCDSPQVGRTLFLAIIDQGPTLPPTVLWESCNSTSPSRVAIAAEFRHLLTTVSFPS